MCRQGIMCERMNKFIYISCVQCVKFCKCYLTEGGEAGLDATTGQLHAQLIEGSGHHFLLLLADCLHKNVRLSI